MKRFSAFLERKDRENKDHLRLLGIILEKAGFQVKDHLNHHEDPYLYIEKPIDHDPIIEVLEFGGIRLYTRGKDIVAFRPQNKEAAEPFGAAYLLDVKGMFKDLMKEGHDEKTGLDLVRYIVEELTNFFLHSAKAQKEDETDVEGEGGSNDPLGKVVGAKDANSDYASQVSGDLRRNATN